MTTILRRGRIWEQLLHRSRLVNFIHFNKKTVDAQENPIELVILKNSMNNKNILL